MGGLAFLVRDGETGYTVPEGDPSALCDKLTLLLSDHELREQMAVRAAEYAQGYNWKKIAAQIANVYEGLIEKQEFHSSKGE